MDRTRHEHISTYDQVVQEQEVGRMMTDFEEMSLRYQASLTNPKIQKFFLLVLKLQEEIGVDDLQDLERLFEMIKAHNTLQQKERTWGHKFEDHLSHSQKTDQLIIKLLKEKISPKIDQEEAKKNLEKIAGGKNK